MNPALISLILLALLAAAPPPAVAAWSEASTDQFVLLAEESPQQLQALAQRLQRFDRALRHLRQLPVAELSREQRLTLYIVDRDTMDELAERGTAGLYVGRAAGPIAFVLRNAAGSDRALFHEYTHHVLASSYALAWPLWLKEGFAEFFATAGVRADGSVDVGLQLKERAFELGQLQYVPLDPLLLMSDAQLRVQPALSYTRSWLLVHYLTFDASRRGQLDRYLALLVRGSDPTETARTVFGDLAALDRGFKAHGKQPLESLNVPSSVLQVGAVKVRELSSAEQAIVPYRIRSQLGAANAATLLAELSKAAEPYPREASVQLALAEAELDAGNFAAAEAAADRAIGADATLVEAHLYKGRARMAAAARVRDPRAWAAARECFLEARRLDPQDPEPMALFYASFVASREPPSKEAVADLYRAVALAPQDLPLRVLAAYQYLADGKAEPARSMLQLIAYDSAAGELGTRMGAVLTKLAQRGPAAALAGFTRDELLAALAGL